MLNCHESLLLSAAQAAKMLSVSRSHFLNLDKRGLTPPPIRLGGAVRWRRDEMEAWVAVGCPPRAKWLAMRE